MTVQRERQRPASRRTSKRVDILSAPLREVQATHMDVGS
jgi:hypothetical protein